MNRGTAVLTLGLLAVATSASRGQYPAACPGPVGYGAPAVQPFVGSSYAFAPPGYPAAFQSYYAPSYYAAPAAAPFPSYYQPRYLNPGPYYYTRTYGYTPGYYSYYYTPGYFRY